MLNFRELRKGEVRRIYLLSTPVNKRSTGCQQVRGRIPQDVRERIHSPIIATAASASGIAPQ
jgi:hypothetical protein